MAEGVRIDKWLWSVRIYKTRSQATEACRAGKIRTGDHAVKPSHEVRTGEVFHVSFAGLDKIVKVLELLGHRVAAKDVPQFMEDLTPADAYENLKKIRNTGFEHRLRGIGRPTKRHRREIEYLKKYLEE
jgi:ribosome-associated heat shock protein Hsp15